MQPTLASVMAQEPTLTLFGFGVYESTSTADRDAKLSEGRRALREHAERIKEICAWIQRYLWPIQSWNTRWGSYGLKHRAEDDINYVANGEFIAAMLICGYRHQKNGPNAYFNVSQQAINAVRQRQRMAIEPRAYRSLTETFA